MVCYVGLITNSWDSKIPRVVGSVVTIASCLILVFTNIFAIGLYLLSVAGLSANEVVSTYRTCEIQKRIIISAMQSLERLKL